MDYQKAFTVIFEDEKWISKILIGGLLSIASFLIFPAWFVFGYLVEYTQNVSKGNMGLPEWSNMGEKFVKGFKLSVVIFIYALPAILIIGIPMVLFLIFSAVGLSSDSAFQAVAPIAAIFMIIGYIFYFLYLLFLYFLIPALTVRYAQTESIGECLKVKEIFAIAKAHLADILMLILFLFVSGIITNIGIIACFVGVFFTGFYGMLTVHNLYGQFSSKLNAEGKLGQ